MNSELELGDLGGRGEDEGVDEEGMAASATLKAAATKRKSHLSDPPLPPATISSLLHHPPTRATLIVYWIFSFCITVTDEIIPLFALCDNRGGLSLEVHKIGLTLSSSGIVYILIQYRMYKFFSRKIGMKGCLILAISFFVPATVLIPAVLFVQGEGGEGGEKGGDTSNLTWAAFIYLAVIIGITRAFASMFFSSITLMSNATVHKSHRGTMNGLSMLGGSVAKMLAPISAGTLFAVCVAGFIDERVGSFLAFGLVSFAGTVCAVMASRLQVMNEFD